jgi:hypothetical protein
MKTVGLRLPLLCSDVSLSICFLCPSVCPCRMCVSLCISRAVLVEKIPRELRSRSKLTAYFHSMYPDAVAKVGQAIVLTRRGGEGGMVDESCRASG